jgi:ribosomal protein S18 acetylase RimI-like enzyme
VKVDERFEIRAARPEDTPEIARIHVDAWRDAYAALLPADYLARLNPKIEAARWSRSSRVESTLVADVDGDVVGYAIIGPARHRETAWGEIYALYVETDWREQGIGRALIEESFRRFRARGFPGAVVWCLEGNAAAIGFYRRCGGKMLGERRLDRVQSLELPVVGFSWEGPEVTL